jgi:hypothetical protein
MFVLPYVEPQPLYNAYNQLGDSRNDAALSGLLGYMGPANLTVTQTRLNGLTCPSDSPNALAAVLHHIIKCANYENTDTAQT